MLVGMPELIKVDMCMMYLLMYGLPANLLSMHMSTLIHTSIPTPAFVGDLGVIAYIYIASICSSMTSGELNAIHSQNHNCMSHKKQVSGQQLAS